ncbi:MAG: hypothetical protein SCK28_13410 [Bacillota bacterium]|nr:hypothetical protein [Bacillota bacterium]
MKKVEVIRFEPKSIFKVIMYMMILPTVILLTIGLIILFLGLFTANTELLIVGAMMIIGYPLVLLIFQGLIGMLAAFIYNKFAERFGGLELQLNENTESES